jgi:hypothetical protein
MCVSGPYDKMLLVPVAISISAPQYLLDVQSLPHLPFGAPICLSAPRLLASPFYLMCSFNTNDKRSHGSMSSHHTQCYLFFYEQSPQKIFSSKKGPHPKRRHLCFGEHISSWSNDNPSCSYVPGCDLILINILFDHLRRMDPHPSLTATWRMIFSILVSYQNFDLRKPKFCQTSSHYKVI